ncbi:uncharacterized protein L969DRAFT_46524 [Mixia osmundae IAM 14324]|uniref:Peptidase A1 domain-containing protein n=1 Tax=Mixia osmundae (strain CBS 9802 / IAM 14324 / JCM 22182 / KY 12970) TaxID=764103 RepID=G7E696_MIXOS|nr:uncharacterized protein L969DRAFT_46524 [Mixia osmundae IAM 14324]KEI40488.1 hypothetical protein L969DRAFT_46524 [Mixia osmundae IAM 14324]GAA98356.1 hypothetical protein E5Q_05042 [Mixia osmundae IAM 14324]
MGALPAVRVAHVKQSFLTATGQEEVDAFGRCRPVRGTDVSNWQAAQIVLSQPLSIIAQEPSYPDRALQHSGDRVHFRLFDLRWLESAWLRSTIPLRGRLSNLLQAVLRLCMRRSSPRTASASQPLCKDKMLDSMVLFSLATVASAVITLPVHRLPVQKDALARRHHRNLPISEIGHTAFYTNITVGGILYPNVIIDTGSSISWVQNFVLSHSGINTTEHFKEKFGDGSSVDAFMVRDTVGLGKLRLNTTIGSVLTGSRPDSAQANGIIGFGPEFLARQYFDKPTRYRVLMEELVAAGAIERNVLCLTFKPVDTTASHAVDSQAMTLGGINASLLQSPPVYTPRLPAILNPQGKPRLYWSALVEFPSIGLLKTDSKAAYTLFDSGTTFSAIPKPYFDKWFSQIPGAFMDAQVEAVGFPRSSIEHIPSLDFRIEGVTFAMPGASLLLPDDYAASLGFDIKKNAYSFVTKGDEGKGGIFGVYHHERFAVVLDADNETIGVAKTSFSPA